MDRVVCLLHPLHPSVSITLVAAAFFSACRTCFHSVSIAHGAPDFLRPVAVLEAGSVPTLRLLPGIPNREGSAVWQAYATGTVITGKAHNTTCAGPSASC